MALFMQLAHGRATPYEEMNDFGSQGPVVGPFESFALDYDFLKLHRPHQQLLIHRENGLIYLHGVYYGISHFSTAHDGPTIWPLEEQFVPPLPRVRPRSPGFVTAAASLLLDWQSYVRTGVGLVPPKLQHRTDQLVEQLLEHHLPWQRERTQPQESNE